MRPLLLALAATAAAGAAAAAQPSSPHRHDRVFAITRLEADVAKADGETAAGWEAQAWVGGDVGKLRLRTEGEARSSEVEHAELQALYSRRVSTFWDAVAGVRVDLEPRARTSLALGVQGLAPYRVETEATAFIAEDGEVGARLKHRTDLRLTQRVVLEPSLELDAEPGDGLTGGEAALQLRYEVTRRFAPYIELAYARKLGEAADEARAAGARRGEALLKAGIRAWF